MKITQKIAIIFITFIITIAIITTLPEFAFANENFNLDGFENDNVTGTASAQKLVNDTAITAIAVARVVCVAIAVVILLVISMKYMMSAPGDRADIKKHAVHYVIGAFILFGITGILGILNNIALQIK